jgi:hypothetical protein
LRREVRFHLTTLLWMATLFVVQIQIWWAFYNARRDAQWNFFFFLVSLVIPVLGYMLCYLIVPDLEASELDLGASYHANRPWFFGLVAAAWLVSFGQDLLGGAIPLDRNTVFRLAFLALALVAMRVRREWYHVLNAVLSLALFCFYVFEEFLRLA